MPTVFIDGQSGTTGLEIHRRLRAREDIALLELDPSHRRDPVRRQALLNQADVAILCLPDAAAREAVALIENPDTRVLDASTAHRVTAGWAYGFPELSPAHRRAVAESRHIAVPGCHATGFLAAVYPLVQAGVLPRSAQLACHSVTGYSGGGKEMIAAYQDPARPGALSSPRQYGLGGGHKHLPEMTQIAGLSTPPVFQPIVCDFYAGMAVSVPLCLPEGSGVTRATLRALLAEHYAGEPFVTVEDAPPDGFLPANLLAGTNRLTIYVCGSDTQPTLTSVLDNLGKGASGAAMQCMNLALGLPETAGFTL